MCKYRQQQYHQPAQAEQPFGKRGFDDAVQREPQEVVEQLVNGGGETVPFRQVVEGLSQSMVNTGQVNNLAAVWLYRNCVASASTILFRASSAIPD